jgi:hypothetical protein
MSIASRDGPAEETSLGQRRIGRARGAEGAGGSRHLDETVCAQLVAQVLLLVSRVLLGNVSCRGKCPLAESSISRSHLRRILVVPLGVASRKNNDQLGKHCEIVITSWGVSARPRTELRTLRLVREGDGVVSSFWIFLRLTLFFQEGFFLTKCLAGATRRGGWARVGPPRSVRHEGVWDGKTK